MLLEKWNGQMNGIFGLLEDIGLYGEFSSVGNGFSWLWGDVQWFLRTSLLTLGIIGQACSDRSCLYKNKWFRWTIFLHNNQLALQPWDEADCVLNVAKSMDHHLDVSFSAVMTLKSGKLWWISKLVEECRTEHRLCLCAMRMREF
jgi:hypothetical protein